MDVRHLEQKEEQQNSASMGKVTSPPVPIDTTTIPPELVAPHDPPPAFSTLSDKANDTLPEYTYRADPTASTLPSYARATRPDYRSAMSEEERLASLREFVESKSYQPDFFGGQKGRPEGPANDPFKVFRWANRRIHGERGDVWRRMSVESRRKWEEEGGEIDDAKGEVERRDMDTSKIL